LDLQPHPEGGYFKEVYRSEQTVPNEALPEGVEGSRPYSTSIYFLITSESFSAFHRIWQDELWHFYEGSAIRLHTISVEGERQSYWIGSKIGEGEVPQLVVKGGHWFAAEVVQPNGYALVGFTVGQGVDFRVFELADRQKLLGSFPKQATVIERLTR